MPTVDLSDPDDEDDWLKRLFSGQAQAPSAPAAPTGLSLNGQQPQPQPAPASSAGPNSPPPYQASNIDWAAPPQPTFPANPSDPRYSMPARIGSALGIEAGRIGQGLWNAATLPGDIATGKTTMADPDAQNRVMDLAAATTFGPRASAPEGALTTGWAPAGWRELAQLKKEFPNQPQIDQIAGMTPAEAAGADFGPNGNIYKYRVLDAHQGDLKFTQMAQEGFPQARDVLRDLRGQSGPAAPTPPPPGPSPPTLLDFLYGSHSTATQPASTPWNTFKLKPPNMPPFPANDPYPMSPRPETPRPWPPRY